MSQQGKRAKTEHKDTVNDLAFAEDLLSYFSFLDSSSLSVAIRVSQGWRLAVMVAFRLSTQLRCPTLPPANHQIWAFPSPNLQEVVVARSTFTQEKWISLEQLMVISKFCPRLTHLTLHGHFMRTDTLLYLFQMSKLTSITLLDLKFVKVRHTQVPTPTTQLPFLDNLCIKRCSLKVGSLVPLISQQTQLKHLDLSFTDVNDSEVGAMLVDIPTLHTLRLVNCREITDESISFANNSRLSVLDVCANHQIVVPPSLRSSLVLKISPLPTS
jgi:hypothetical protein